MTVLVEGLLIMRPKSGRSNRKNNDDNSFRILTRHLVWTQKYDSCLLLTREETMLHRYCPNGLHVLCGHPIDKEARFFGGPELESHDVVLCVTLDWLTLHCKYGGEWDLMRHAGGSQPQLAGLRFEPQAEGMSTLVIQTSKRLVRNEDVLGVDNTHHSIFRMAEFLQHPGVLRLTGPVECSLPTRRNICCFIGRVRDLVCIHHLPGEKRYYQTKERKICNCYWVSRQMILLRIFEYWNCDAISQLIKH